MSLLRRSSTSMIDDRDAQRLVNDRRHDRVYQKQGQLMERGDSIGRRQHR